MDGVQVFKVLDPAPAPCTSIIIKTLRLSKPGPVNGVMTLSRLAEFRAAEKALKEQIAQLEALKNNAGLKREIEFEQKLKDLMKFYGKNLRDIIAILDPGTVAPRSGAAPKQRKARVLKVYQNPHTGELIETKGGNHHGLKAWKEQYGASTVDSWLRH